MFYPPAMPVSIDPDNSQQRPDVLISEMSAFGADMKIRRGAWINGVFVGGVTPYIMTGTTNSSGNAVFYPTDNNTATGNPVFTMIPTGGIIAIPIGTASNYQVTTTTVSADLKTVTVGVNQLGTVALGLISVVAAASGVTVTAIIWGK